MRTFKLCIPVIVLIAIGSCQEQDPLRDRAVRTFGDGHPHVLRKIVETRQDGWRASGGYFLIAGSMTAESVSKTEVRFAWQMNDGTYVVSALPLEQVRIRIDDSVKAPTVEFHISERSRGGCESNVPNGTLDGLIKNTVDYIVVTCQESDWPVNIQLPLNN